MLSAFINSWKIPELRQRIAFTFGLIFICRIIAVIPLPGVDTVALQAAANQPGAGGGLMGLFNMFTGGALGRIAVGSLGIMPYISASIILQLMTPVFPMLQKLAREGDTGRSKITQYTRYLTLAICIVQGLMMAITFQNNPGSLGLPQNVVLNPGVGFLIMAVLCLMTGTMLLMWLGEQITERGIGNGVSLIITIGIIASLPAAIMTIATMLQPQGGVVQLTYFHVVALLIIFFAVTAGTVALTQAVRKIPVQHAKRVVANKVYGGGNNYMPLRLNYAGVMPIIFGSALLLFIPPLFNFIGTGWAQNIAIAFQPGTSTWLIVFGVMVFFFSFFWVATQFNPLQIADDLKRNGAYIPGVRPGKATAEFLDRTMTRLTFAGALALTFLAVFPNIITSSFSIPPFIAQFFGGTSLLIMVGVMLDTMRQIESHLLSRHYDGFLRKGKLKSGRRGGI